MFELLALLQFNHFLSISFSSTTIPQTTASTTTTTTADVATTPDMEPDNAASRTLAKVVNGDVDPRNNPRLGGGSPQAGSVVQPTLRVPRVNIWFKYLTLAGIYF